MSIYTQEEWEKIYDNFAENYRYCCIGSKNLDSVLTALKDDEKRKVLKAAKAGWIKNFKLIDAELAKLGER